MIATILIGLLAVYLGIVAIAFAVQGRLVYPVPPVQQVLPQGYEAITYDTPDGLTLAAGYRAAVGDRPTLIFFHGNGSDWQSSAYVTRLLVQEGYGVLAAEYRGYAGNPGSPSEDGLYRDGRAALNFLRHRGVDDGDIVLVGNSIGGGVATQLATEFAPQALVLVSPFDSLPDTAAPSMPFLPVRMLLRDRYDNAAKLPQVEVPILIMHGGQDTLVRVSQARRLAATRSDAELIIDTARGHELMGYDDVQARIAVFLQGL